MRMRCRFGVLVAGVLAALLCLPRASAADAGPQLRAALDSQKVILSPEGTSTFTEAMNCLSQQVNVRGKARVKLGVCHLPDAKPRLEVGTTTGTLREILDKIAANAGYTWEANGEWINFTPLTEPVQMSVVMRRRIPGKVVVSRDRRLCTDVRGLLGDNRSRSAYKVLRFVSTPEAERARQAALSRFPDPIVLSNPMVWEFLNAEHDVYGSDFYDTEVKTALTAGGNSVKSIYLSRTAGGERFADWLCD